jgi:hypothetical protein
MKARLGDCEVDLGARELRRGEKAVHLTPKAFSLLELLLEKRPDAVSKDEIHDRLWPGTFVSGVNLATLVFELRQALGDDPHHPRVLRTVRGFGYALQVEEPPAAPSAAGVGPCCRLITARREIDLREGENVLGRTREAVVWIPSTSASRRHARILVKGGSATLEDLGSKNGTFVGERRIDAPTALADGDSIRVGDALFVFRVLSPDTTDGALPPVTDLGRSRRGGTEA